MTRLVAISVLSLSLILVGRSIGQESELPSKKATADDYKKFAATVARQPYRGKVSAGPKGISIRIDDSGYRADLKKAYALPVNQQKQAIAKVEASYAGSKWALGKEFELEYAPNVQFRRSNVAFEFDEKGFPKVQPAKGADGFYPAKLEDITGDYPTLVTFGALKNGKPTVTRLVVDNSKQ